ncbi:hypothetical protein [Reinekea sp. G2M2-21]|uniref:hypothetical protein n=1 Tax=Reinekea sp. G2M2-21 TaxID=2788942 RepID=UPI0018AC48E5|nr:hypothetical protein [Reinekea sp. G2M2-21]
MPQTKKKLTAKKTPAARKAAPKKSPVKITSKKATQKASAAIVPTLSAEEKSLNKALSQVAKVEEQLAKAKDTAKTAKSPKAKLSAQNKVKSLAPLLASAKTELNKAKLDMKLFLARLPLVEFSASKPAAQAEFEASLAAADEAALAKAIERFTKKWSTDRARANAKKTRKFTASQDAKEKALKKKVDAKCKAIKSPKAKKATKTSN